MEILKYYAMSISQKLMLPLFCCTEVQRLIVKEEILEDTRLREVKKAKDRGPFQETYIPGYFLPTTASI